MAKVAATSAKPKPDGSTPKRGPARSSKAKPAPEPPAPIPGGRPSLLTLEREARIMQAVQLGLPLVLAAAYGGVTYQTMRNWVVRGEAEAQRLEDALELDPSVESLPAEAGYLEFFYAYKKAEATAAVRWMGRIEKASEEHWQAAGWKAERRWPDLFGRQRIELTGEDGKPLVSPVAIYVPENRRMAEESATPPAAPLPQPAAAADGADAEAPTANPARRRLRRTLG